MDISKPKITTLNLVGQSPVINSKQMQASSVPVMNMHRVLDNTESEFVSAAIREPRFHSATSHPDTEAFLWWSRPGGVFAPDPALFS